VKPATLKVFRLLRDAQPGSVTTHQFIEAGCGSRYSARLFELRELGCEIVTKRLRQGSASYTLIYAPPGLGSGTASGGTAAESRGKVAVGGVGSEGIDEPSASQSPADPDRLFDPPADDPYDAMVGR
jgi:hypothetical protein